MIKFFRHIRESLIQENKMGKYFKYAIGEIILVVLGILIALQINNWNEQGKERQIEKRYVDDLLLDLRKDSLDISEVYTEVSEMLRTRDLFNKIIDGNTSNTDSLIYYFNTQWIQLKRFTSTTATIDEIKSNGHFGLIRDLKIKRNVVETYNLFENNKNQEGDYLHVARDIITLLQDVIPSMRNYNKEDVLSLREHPNVLNALGLNYASARTKAFKEILEKCCSTIKQLEEYRKTL